MTSKKMEDYLKKNKKNGRRPQKKERKKENDLKKIEMEDNLIFFWKTRMKT